MNARLIDVKNRTLIFTDGTEYPLPKCSICADDTCPPEIMDNWESTAECTKILTVLPAWFVNRGTDDKPNCMYLYFGEEKEEAISDMILLFS